eukprot:CAMPEP_0169112408 /NCGR_PEP_ID=MMETSP1015-20121227/27624_1 /TAXON_ID=342587 /ORGANISM="Karlodinium micrum, Strain CCMP2283" /LENGTH=76 /DNA_ID=CAMNT_0009174453 /DNA_START=461 /DNA_END=691 /DNA_ORIENTATION=-
MASCGELGKLAAPSSNLQWSFGKTNSQAAESPFSPLSTQMGNGTEFDVSGMSTPTFFEDIVLMLKRKKQDAHSRAE